MISFDDATGENRKEHNSNWPHNPDYPYRILILGDSGPGKTNSLLKLINHQSYIDKIYLYAKDPYEAKYQLLIQKHESVGLKHCDYYSKVFIEYSNEMDDVYENIDEYNSNKKYKIFIVFDIIVDVLSKKTLIQQ